MRIECAYKELVKVDSLIPHPSNRNKHPEKQIEALAKIIAKNGQRSPIVVSTLSGKINKGHGRWLAIKMLGWEKCAVDYQDYKDELEELNDRIADNEIARYAEFDREGFIEDIKNIDVDISSLDFDEFGLIDFKIPIIEHIDEDNDEDNGTKSDEENKKYLLQVTLPNELELRDLYDDLVSKGYIVREM